MAVRITRDIVFKHRSFYTEILHGEVFTQRSLYAEQLYTQKPLHRKAFSQRSLSTQSFFKQEFLHRETFTHRTLTHRCPRFYTQDLLHTFTHKRLYTKIKETFTHTNAPTAFTQGRSYTEGFAQGSFYKPIFFTHRSFYSEKAVNRAALHTEALTHAQKTTHRAAFTQSSLYTQKLLFFRTHPSLCAKELCTRTKELRTNGFTHSSFHTEPIHRPAFTFRRVFTQTPVRKAALT